MKELIEPKVKIGDAKPAISLTENVFQQMAENFKEVLWMCDSESKIMHYINPAYEEVWGKSCQSLYDNPLSFIESIHPDDRNAVIDEVKSLQYKGSFKKEYRILRPDGEQRWISARSFPIRDEKGCIVRTVGIAEDVTERKRVEKDLLRARSELEAHVEERTKELNYVKAALNEHSIVAFTNPQGKITYVNDKFCQLSKYSREELLGQDHRIINSGYHSKTFMSQMWSTISQGKTWKGEIRNRAKDGTFYWLQTTIVPFLDSQGKPYQYVAIRTDITAQKEIEENLRQVRLELEQRVAVRTSELTAVNSKLRAILDSATQFSIITTDTHGFITEFSPGAERLLGYHKLEMIGAAPDKIHLKEEVELHAKELNKEFNTTLSGFDVFVEHARRGQYEEREWTYVRKDGSHVPVSLIVTALKGKDDELVGFLGVATDITEKKKTSEALQAASRVALETARLKSDFLANMSHEIRTPMNGVIGMTGLLLDTHLTEEQKECVNVIRTCGDSLLMIINDILDFSKLESGKLTLENIDFSLLEVIESTLDLFAHQAQSKGIELAFLVEERLKIRGDPGRLRQVLTNLIGNAIKFTKVGEVYVHVLSELQSNEDVTLRFEVSDTGIGIDAADQAKLFNSFVQADSSVTRRFGGTGLGLTISKQLVELMGGHIGVNSSLGKGSTFWITLPFQKQSSCFPEAFTKNPFCNLKALVIDDNQTNQRILSHELKKLGIAISIVSSAEDAIRHICVGASMPDLILLDMHLPGIDGISLAKELKKKEALTKSKMILISSVGAVDGQQLKNSGFDAQLIKPIKPTQLINCLRRIFDSDHADDICVHNKAIDNCPLGMKGRLLIVDDNGVNQRVVSSQLHKLGYSAESVANGLEALDALQRQNYLAVLMDCQMPEMDGYDATRMIRQREGNDKHTIVIAMTAHALEGDREKCLAAGMDDYISKPITTHELSKILHKWIQRKSAIKLIEENEGNQGSVLNFDKATFLDATDGTAESIREITNLYLSQANEMMISLRNALQERDAREIKRLSHKLAGSSGVCGAVAMAQLCREIENANEDERVPKTSHLVPRLERELEAATIILNEIGKEGLNYETNTTSR
jgi:PAS domain S-box-containing protein